MFRQFEVRCSLMLGVAQRKGPDCKTAKMQKNNIRFPLPKCKNKSKPHPRINLPVRESHRFVSQLESPIFISVSCLTVFQSGPLFWATAHHDCSQTSLKHKIFVTRGAHAGGRKVEVKPGPMFLSKIDCYTFSLLRNFILYGASGTSMWDMGR